MAGDLRDSTDTASAFAIERNARTLVERPEGTVYALDGLRAVAVLWVIAYHTWKRVGGTALQVEYEGTFRVANRGLLGVDVFFVLSGFLISSLLLREVESTGRIAFGRFYVRRALRILPVYWLTLAIFCVIDGENAGNAWANVFFVNNLQPESAQAMKWTWSLAIEEQFYLLFPLILAVGGSRRLHLLLGLFIAGIGVRAWLVRRYALHLPSPDHARLYYDVLYDKTYARFGELLAGAIAAYAVRSDAFLASARNARIAAPLGMVAAVAVIGGLALVDQPIFRYEPGPTLAFLFYTLSHVAFSAAVAWTIVACIARAPGARLVDATLSWRGFRPVAVLSYSAYLIHVMVIDAGPFGRAKTLGAMLVAFVTVPLATLIAATPLYLLVERPLMNVRERQKQS